jgi:hypothetical protein
VEPQTSEPQQVQFQTQATCGASHDFGADWVQYAMNTEAPGFVGGVDPARNPQLGGHDDGGTAYA